MSHQTIKRVIWMIITIFIIFLATKIIVPYPLLNTQSIKVYDKDNQIIYDVRNDYRQTNYQSIKEVPQFLQDLLIAQEDKRFYSHRGLDLGAILRATWVKITTWKKQWGSTIDQQVIKLSKQNFDHRTIAVKLKEIFWAININFHYSKDEIFLYYINNIYFPHGVKWFATACQIYFGQECQNLSEGHLVYLYSTAKYPSSDNLSNYNTYIINWLSGHDYTYADFEKISNQQHFYINQKAGHFVQYTLSTQKPNIENKIYTKFDQHLYTQLQNVIAQYEPHLQAQEADQVCIIVLKDQNIISMNLLQEYGDNYINGCTTPRQVGSAIKPFSYLQSFAQLGYSPDTKILDKKIVFESTHGSYSPQNFDMQYHGEITLAQALGSSLNIPAVKIVHQLGIENFYQFLTEVSNMVGSTDKRDIDIYDIGLSLALGVKPISPLNFARMRQIFAPDFCQNKSGNQSINNFCSTYQEYLSSIRQILSQNQNRLLWFNNNNRFTSPASYGKSGTSRHFIDGRICWWKKGYTVCIRAGNYDNSPMHAGGHDVVGPLRYAVMWLLN